MTNSITPQKNVTTFDASVSNDQSKFAKIGNGVAQTGIGPLRAYELTNSEENFDGFDVPTLRN
jgi:hypothetical protein